MSRRDKALIAAAFNYAGTLLSVLIGFYLTRLLVHDLGTDQYGTWLASGGLLAYAGLAEFGIFGVMPWLFAEADGEKDLDRARSLVIHGLLAGLVAGVLYVLLSFGLWLLLPRLVHLSVKDQHTLAGPIALMIGVTALGYPFRLFQAMRGGLQDFKFLGICQLIGTTLSAIVTYVMLVRGFGLYSIAASTVIAASFSSVACAVRTVQKNPEFLRQLPRPSWAGTRPILTAGGGTLLSTLGWQLASATDAMVIAYLGDRALVPLFMITSRVGLTLMQMAWSLPDGALVGLANLGAEGNRARTAEIVQTLMRLTLIPVGAVACAVLASNAAFVRVWVGAYLYGGTGLNALLTLAVVTLSVTHAIVTPAAVLGSRVEIGLVTVANGVAHILLALLLGHWFGLAGVAIATTLSALLTTIPVGLHYLAKRTGISPHVVLKTIVFPWAARSLPCALAALLAGWATAHWQFVSDSRIGAFFVGGVLASVAVAVYMWLIRSLLVNLPFGPRVTKILTLVRLV